MHPLLDRRAFLHRFGTGVALLLLPASARGGWGRAAFDAQRTLSTLPGDDGFDRFGIGTALLRRTLDRALARGGDFAEIYLEHAVDRSLGLEDGAVNRAYASVALGAGIRVLKGDATGYAYSEDLSERALRAAASTAAVVADANAGAETGPLAMTRHESRYPVAVPWSAIGVDRKVPLVQAADTAARSHDPRIARVSVNFSDSSSRILVANSEGMVAEDDRPMGLVSVTCVARAGDRSETAVRFLSGREEFSWFTPERVATVARETAARAIRLFEAVPAPAGEMPVVLAAGSSGILLHEAIGHGMEADFNRKGTSVYSGRIGQRVAAPEVTILDDGTMGRLRGSLNIDDEGTPAQRTLLVENGILRSYLHDRISAAFYGVACTGSGRRESFRYPPVPRMRNTYMPAGSRDPNEIVASVARGLYAEEFSNGQVDIGGGDFTFYLRSGRLIENGKLTAVVKDANLIGNGPRVLERIDLVGSDFAMAQGGGSCGKDGQSVPVSFGLPTVRVSAITVGGRGA
jgi:TldD protein